MARKGIRARYGRPLTGRPAALAMVPGTLVAMVSGTVLAIVPGTVLAIVPGTLVATGSARVRTPGAAPVVAAARAPVQESPVEVIRARNAAVQRILETVGEDPGPEARERLKDVINGLIDFRELSRLALGKYWDERTEQERSDFVRVFRELIRNSSVKKLEIYRADRLTYELTSQDDGKADVTTVAYKGRKSVEIVYRMHRVGGEWKVYDMVVDGASTARTYRDSFYREIDRSSYRDMYDKLVRKLEEEESDR